MSPMREMVFLWERMVYNEFDLDKILIYYFKKLFKYYIIEAIIRIYEKFNIIIFIYIWKKFYSFTAGILIKGIFLWFNKLDAYCSWACFSGN